MIYEINQMIDYLDDFFSGSKHDLIVGGITGTQIERYALDAALKTTPFHKILVVNGCQDYVAMMKSPMQNVKFYGDLFVEQVVDPLIPYDPWKPRILNPKEEYIKILDISTIAQYDVIVVLNAHLIQEELLHTISDNFSGKIVYVTDPIESCGCSLMWRMGLKDMPVVVDHLEKLSPIQAMARSSVGFDTRAVDYRVRGTVNEVNKINKRSIGKIDDKQYMTNDHQLYHEIRDRMMESPFRKNQRVMITDNIVDVMLENGCRKATLVRGSMVVIDNPNNKPLMKLRLYNSNIYYAADVTYKNGVLKPRGTISVEPANIMNFEEDFIKHRYTHTVLILDYEISKRARYSILKNSNNVTIVNKFKSK